MYAGAAVMGYTMFGEAILSQFTLNMPKELVATNIAVWTTVYLFYILFQIFFLVETSLLDLHFIFLGFPHGNEY